MEIPVVIVTYHSAAHIRACLQSIPAGSDIYVVDNQSTDETLSILKQEFPQVQVLEQGFNSGYASAVNRALLNLSSRYCLVLNPDVVLGKDCVQLLHQALETSADCWCAGPAVRNRQGKYIRAYGKFPSLLRLLCEQSFLYKFFPGWYQQRFFYDPSYAQQGEQKVQYISGAVMLLRADLVRAAGGFDEDFFLYSEETELAWRMLQQGWHCQLLPAADAIHDEGAAIQRLPSAEQMLIHRQSLLLFFKKSKRGFRMAQLICFVGDFLRLLIKREKVYLQLLRLNLSLRRQ